MAVNDRKRGTIDANEAGDVEVRFRSGGPVVGLTAEAWPWPLVMVAWLILVGRTYWPCSFRW